MQLRTIAVFSFLLITNPAIAQPHLGAAAITSGGTLTASGSIVAIGQPVIGLVAAPSLSVHLGIVPILTASNAPPCYADFNQDGGIDGADVESFFFAWEGGNASSDVNQDGGIDGADVETFFAAWENGGCG